jgi:hypothetical protein
VPSARFPANSGRWSCWSASKASYEEVAEIIGVPVGTVRLRLSRGREALRQLVGIVPDRHAAAGFPLVTAAHG